MTTATDKKLPAGTTNSGSSIGAAHAAAAKGGYQNIMGVREITLPDGQSHKMLDLYGFTAPGTDYANAPIGSTFTLYKYDATNDVMDTCIPEKWVKKSSTLWVKCGNLQVLEQAAEPTTSELTENQPAIWRDSDDSDAIRLAVNNGSSVVTTPALT